MTWEDVKHAGLFFAAGFAASSVLNLILSLARNSGGSRALTGLSDRIDTDITNVGAGLRESRSGLDEARVGLELSREGTAQIRDGLDRLADLVRRIQESRGETAEKNGGSAGSGVIVSDPRNSYIE